MYMVKGRPKTVVYWLAELRAGLDDPVRLSEEHVAHRWLPLQEAVALQGFQEMTRLLQECERYIQDKE
ncbi:hypothetical protein HAZT_HAZT012163 [Hyalella azteca]|uniref:Bis(5'-nucleosyl)-tetraphosphatase [asymmetrical] n=1 Tax=Hyalella azteca TaxID=294128 RepID=A0A6A0GPG6_HYAAZ|nr:hypothetical protein HAZT_HAZT012163 [Hyalella azteca]